MRPPADPSAANARRATPQGGCVAACAAALLAAVVVAGAPEPSRAQSGFFSDGLGFGFSDPSEEQVTFSAEFAAATADRPAVLAITAEIQPGWYIYSITQPKGGPQATTITLDPSNQYRLIGSFAADPEPESHIEQEVPNWEGLEIQKHKYEVVWYVPIEIAEGVSPGSLKITGRVEAQACEQSCVQVEQEFTARLAAGVTVGPLDMTAPAGPPTPPTGPVGGDQPPAPSRGAYDIGKIELDKPMPFTTVLAISVLGGLILNVMPCVLPVIGLKIMSFINQAGQSRAKAFTLNLWYSLGILSVFLVLAGLVAFFGATFGSHFGDVRFNVVMSTIVFALALSMLGVWEIPIPGFAGSSSAQEMANQEGELGAFLKGVLTTILATPCTGPYVGAALGWTVRQPPLMTFAVFSALAFGMALPYLLIGAFPSLMRFLPKPGAWMEAFKQLMGFVLMGTVIWMLSFLPTEMIVPALVLFAMVAVACWLYARTPLSASRSDWAQTYVLCGAIVVAGAVFSFEYLLPGVFRPRFDDDVAEAANEQAAESYNELLAKLRDADPAERELMLADTLDPDEELTEEPYQLFTLEKLANAVEQDKTVLVDFSADWCQVCKTYEQAVLHTDPVDKAIADAGVVTMYGDFTRKPAWLDATLKALGSNGVPVIAVFPAGEPYRPIVFRGAYTQEQLIEAIKNATQHDAPTDSGESVARALDPAVAR